MKTALLTGMLAMAAGTVAAQPTFLVSNGSTLYRTTLGGATETFNLGDDIVGMTVAADGTIYATSSTASATSGLFELYTLENSGGAAPSLSLVTDQLANVYTALTFIGGDLYSSLGGGPRLVNIDLNTFAETEVGNTAVFNVGGAAYDQNSDTLYWSSGIEDALYSIDYNTAAATMIGSLGIDVSQQGMDFFEFDGTLYHAVDNETTGRFELGTTDTSTGAYTFLQTIVDANLEGSTSIAIIPAPGSVALLGLGGLVATRRRR